MCVAYSQLGRPGQSLKTGNVSLYTATYGKANTEANGGQSNTYTHRGAGSPNPHDNAAALLITVAA